jgi:hypothetical protein
LASPTGPNAALALDGTFDAVHRRMKDIVLIGVSVAFFALSWLYAQSFDRL